ncbi:MAG: hypothetical protein ACEPO8_15210, partial [Rhodothermaceae bacterium]
EDVNEIAKTFALILGDKKSRKLLKKAMETSPTKENILELSSLLKHSFNKKDPGNKFLKKFIKRLKKKNPSLLNKLTNLEFGLFDVLMPYREHYNNWNGKQEVLVAAASSCTSDRENMIKAYDKNGDVIFIAPDEIPEIPVVAVLASEKYGKYLESQRVQNLQFSNAAPIGFPTDPPAQYMTYVTELYTEIQYDGGACGSEMEFRVDTRKRYDGITSKWHNHNDGDPRGPYDIKLKKSFNPNLLIETHHTYSHEVQVVIWEEDGWFCGGDDEVENGAWDMLWAGDNHMFHDQMRSNVTFLEWRPWGSIYRSVVLQNGEYNSGNCVSVRLRFIEQ